MSIVEKLNQAITDAGIKLINNSPIQSFDAIRGTELEQAFGRIACEFVKLPEWKAEGQPTFYELQSWKRVRYMALAQHGNRCQCCGAGPKDGAVLHVDHVKPKSKHPELAFSISNLQVLCADCNLGKSNVDETDWRA